MRRRFTREERRKFRKKWRMLARKASPEVRAKLGIGHYPTQAEKAVRRELVRRAAVKVNSELR